MFIQVKAKKVHKNISAPTDGIVEDKQWRHLDVERETFRLQVVHESGTPVYSIQVKESLDGVTYTDVGAAVTTAGLSTTRSARAPFVNIDVVSLTGGNISVFVG